MKTIQPMYVDPISGKEIAMAVRMHADPNLPAYSKATAHQRAAAASAASPSKALRSER